MGDPADRLIETVRRRLSLVTLALLGVLVLAIGGVTAFAGLRALDADVDHALDATARDALAKLEGELPAAQGPSETEDARPASADTFLLYLDAKGHVIADPARVGLAGLPDEGGVASAARSVGADWRTVTAGGLPVRLLTLPILGSGTDDGAAGVIGFVQAGFVLTLHERQSASLLAIIALACLAGLVGAAFVAVVVTRRALVPIRRTFEAQRRFVADASHELRTPAAIIRSTAEVLEREAHVDAAGLPLVADIVAESDRLGRLVADLLTLAASDASPLVVRTAPVDVADLVARTVRRVAPIAAGRNVVVALDGTEPCVVACDADRIVQLVVILLDNAIDHSPEGSTVTVGVARSGGAALVTVSDQGAGVPEADRDRIFRPFERLPGVARHRAGGTGLGLAIASRIVDAHKGTIRVDDAPGGGARFSVTLPGAHA